MTKIQEIRCPNCGSIAKRTYLNNDRIVETSCRACDYLMVSCPQTGQVIESYAPGIASPCS